MQEVLEVVRGAAVGDRPDSRRKRTGKELLARMIHRGSASGRLRRPAQDRPFIAVNLAAIPRDLVESTLFGHERGAFTGAVQQRIGKFELASGGSPSSMKSVTSGLIYRPNCCAPFRRAKSSASAAPSRSSTSFRLIAATNIDLERAVKDGTFREDLFYRLNVIPVKLPPLRDRIEDLPELAEFFLQRYSTRFHKRINGIAESTLRMLGHYWWPGNIREAREPDRTRRRHLRWGLDHR